MKSSNPSPSTTVSLQDTNKTFLLPMSYEMEFANIEQDVVLQTFDIRTCLCFVVAANDGSYLYMAHVDALQTRNFLGTLQQKIEMLLDQEKEIKVRLFGKAAEVGSLFNSLSEQFNESNSSGPLDMKSYDLGAFDGVQVSASPHSDKKISIAKVEQNLIDQAPLDQKLRYEALNDLRFLETFIIPSQNRRCSTLALVPNELVIPMENKELGQKIQHLKSLPDEESKKNALLKFLFETNQQDDTRLEKELLKNLSERLPSSYKNYENRISTLEDLKNNSVSKLSGENEGVMPDL